MSLQLDNLVLKGSTVGSLGLKAQIIIQEKLLGKIGMEPALRLPILTNNMTLTTEAEV